MPSLGNHKLANPVAEPADLSACACVLVAWRPRVTPARPARGGPPAARKLRHGPRARIGNWRSRRVRRRPRGERAWTRERGGLCLQHMTHSQGVIRHSATSSDIPKRRFLRDGGGDGFEELDFLEAILELLSRHRWRGRSLPVRVPHSSASSERMVSSEPSAVAFCRLPARTP